MNKLPTTTTCVLGLCLGQSLLTTQALGQTGPTAPPTVPLENPLEKDAPREADAPDEAHEAVASAPGDPWGDTQELGLISLRALFQTRYTTTFASKSESSRDSYRVREDNLVQQDDGFRVQRAMLRISSDPVQYVGFRMVLDFAQLIDNDPEDVVKQAYATLRPIPKRLEFMVGLFKVPFALTELDPTSRHEFADFGPTNQLLGSLDFAGRDLGIQAMLAPLRKPKHLRIYLGTFRTHSYDEHDLPVGALAGRVEAKPHKSLRFGVGMIEHLQSVTYNRPFNTSNKDVVVNPSNPLFPTQRRWDRGRAWGVDARFKKKGFMLRGEYLHGDRVDVDERYDARTFWAAWGIVSYRIALARAELLPAARAEWLDADREHRRGMHRTLSVSFSVRFLERVRILFDATRTDVEDDTAVIRQPRPLQQQPYLALDNTRFTTQLQLEL